MYGDEKVLLQGQTIIKAITDLPVHLYRIDLSFHSEALSGVGSCLSPQEMSKMTRFHDFRDRVRFGVTRFFLRSLISKHACVANQHISLTTNQFGKPQLTASLPNIVDFNVSHSGAHSLIVLSESFEVGVDIEYVDDRFDWDPLMQESFDQSERLYIESLPEDERQVGFFQIWTAKEAGLKALGTGFLMGTDALAAVPSDDGDSRSFDVHLEERAVLRPAISIKAITAPNDYVASIAILYSRSDPESAPVHNK
jgi:4'-phosphopantetheinyl transferase